MPEYYFNIISVFSVVGFDKTAIRLRRCDKNCSIWPLLGVWMSLIFYLSFISGDELGPDTLIINLIKKSVHFIIFGVLAVLYLSTLTGRKLLAETGNVLIILSLFFTLIYAISDEYHQSFTSGRHSSDTT